MLNIDASLIVVFLTVWVLVAVLKKIFFNPLRKIMGERETKLEEDRKTADKASESFEQTSIQIEEQLRAARAMAKATREKFEHKGLKEKEHILEETNRSCRSQIEEAKEKLNRQLESLKKELEYSSKRLAERIEQRLLN